MTTITQHFMLYISDKEDMYDLDDNLSYLPQKEKEQKFYEYMQKYALNPNGRYVAVGDAGDSIIYDAGTFYHTSDSG